MTEPAAPTASPEPRAETAARTPEAAELGRILEAVLLAAEAPLSLDALMKLAGEPLGLTRGQLREGLGALDTRLLRSACLLVEVAGGWRVQIRAEYSEWVARLHEERPPRLTRATLETLALIVYRQPITRGEIEEIRGVAVSPNILRSLLERGWIRELGHKEAPGRPALFGSTAQLLDDLGLRSLNQLPPLPDIRDLNQLESALAQLALPLGAVDAPDEDPARLPQQAPLPIAHDTGGAPHTASAATTAPHTPPVSSAAATPADPHSDLPASGAHNEKNNP